jgi:homoserine O-acetyltransferase
MPDPLHPPQAETVDHVPPGQRPSRREEGAVPIRLGRYRILAQPGAVAFGTAYKGPAARAEEKAMGLRALAFAGLFLLSAVASLRAADYPPPAAGDYTLREHRFASGETLPELRLHYRTLGEPRRDDQGVVRNAVLILHGTTGSGGQFLRPEFAGELFGKGQPLDATRFFIILPDGIGHGGSGKPSDGLRARFPRYGYRDMVASQHRLLTEGLKVNHLRLVLGTSMGGMHTWLWGETYPDFMDALMPLACLPTQIAGRNRLWRRIIIDAVRNDPAWKGGAYTAQPPALRTAAEVLMLMSSNPVLRQKEAPTLKEADERIDAFVAQQAKALDANDVLYALESSRDYDPAPGLETIRASLRAVNFADDLINPPELGILERAIKRVKRGKAVLVPMSEQTRGHGTHTLAAVWKSHLEELLKESER